MSEEKIEAVAIAIRNAAREFGSPVYAYVEPEARRRWETANPDKDSFEQPTDWELESWKILARAALNEKSPPPG